MAYITYQQYIDLYGSSLIGEDDFPVYAQTASDLIDSITRYKIVQGGGITSLPALTQQLVQKATAAQILYFAQNGLETVLVGESGTGFTVGKVHVDGTSRSAKRGNIAAQSMISPLAVTLLEQTGLMGRDVACYGPYRNGFLGIW